MLRILPILPIRCMLGIRCMLLGQPKHVRFDTLLHHSKIVGRAFSILPLIERVPGPRFKRTVSKERLLWIVSALCILLMGWWVGGKFSSRARVEVMGMAWSGEGEYSKGGGGGAIGFFFPPTLVVLLIFCKPPPCSCVWYLRGEESSALRRLSMSVLAAR